MYDTQILEDYCDKQGTKIAQKVLDIIDQDKLYLMIVNEQYFYIDCGYDVPNYVYKYIKRHIRKLYNLKLKQG